METWDIYDEYGNKTGRTVIRGEKLAEGDYHLVVHIWIMNDNNEYLIQKRTDHLKHMPGIWATTGGSAIKGEDSQTAAIREVEEELGIEPNTNKMKKIKRIKRKDNFADIWFLQQNISLDEIEMLKEEVSDVKWVSKETLNEMIENGIFHNYGSEYISYIFNYNLEG